MVDIKLQNIYPERETFFPRMYSPNLQPLLQSLLSAVADMDFEYECEREKLSGRPLSRDEKIRRLETLRAQHQIRREPYVRQLAVLQKRMFDLKAV